MERMSDERQTERTWKIKGEDEDKHYGGWIVLRAFRKTQVSAAETETISRKI